MIVRCEGQMGDASHMGNCLHLGCTPTIDAIAREVLKSVFKGD